MRLNNPVALDRVGGPDEPLSSGQAVGVETEGSQRHGTEDQGRRDPDGARPPGDCGADSRPQSRGGGIDCSFVRICGPEHPSPDDHKQGREERQHGQHADPDTDRGYRSQTLGRVQIGDKEAEHAEHNSSGAGEDRGAGPMEGLGHGLVPIMMAAQLFAVARHEEQGVVGTRAEDEDGQDAGALRVDGQIGVFREQIDDPLRTAERAGRRDNREEPENRTAVYDEQDQYDDRDRGQQQGAVDSFKGRR